MGRILPQREALRQGFDSPTDRQARTSRGSVDLTTQRWLFRTGDRRAAQASIILGTEVGDSRFIGVSEQRGTDKGGGKDIVRLLQKICICRQSMRYPYVLPMQESSWQLRSLLSRIGSAAQGERDWAHSDLDYKVEGPGCSTHRIASGHGRICGFAATAGGITRLSPSVANG